MSSANTYEDIKRAAADVRLVAVSKRQPITKITALYENGQRDFAENFVQEALEKIQALAMLNITWHFIGRIQSNKLKQIATAFDWVQSVDSLKAATRLNTYCEVLDKKMQVCVCVNLDNEAQKSGVAPAALIELATQIQLLSHLALRGIMLIPQPQQSYEQQRVAFTRAKQLFDELKLVLPQVDTLSMGMSDDYQAAIDAGSTMIRIGTALFGKRDA